MENPSAGRGRTENHGTFLARDLTDRHRGLKFPPPLDAMSRGNPLRAESDQHLRRAIDAFFGNRIRMDVFFDGPGGPGESPARLRLIVEDA